MNEEEKSLLPEEVIMSKILFIRGLKVMIERNIAELYGVSTKRLNEQVKRNLKRFPEDSCSGFQRMKPRRWSQIATTF